MTRQDLEVKYREKAKRLGIEEGLWGKERANKLRLTQNHAVYAGMVEAMDEAVGTVLAKLQELGLDNKTIVIFFSDNGGLSTSEGHPTSNLPLRAGKGWLYEGGIREPMIVRWPGTTTPASICHEPVVSTDFYPTMLEMAGIKLKPKQHMDGVSLVPLLEGGKMDRRIIYWHYPHYSNQGSAPGAAIRDGQWKLIKWFEDNALELYNLEADIGETNNLADRHPDTVKQLHEKLQAWQIQVDAKLPTRITEQHAGQT